MANSHKPHVAARTLVHDQRSKFVILVSFNEMELMLPMERCGRSIGTGDERSHLAGKDQKPFSHGLHPANGICSRETGEVGTV